MKSEEQVLPYFRFEPSAEGKHRHFPYFLYIRSDDRWGSPRTGKHRLSSTKSNGLNYNDNSDGSRKESTYVDNKLCKV